jgi:hypothetical protein
MLESKDHQQILVARGALDLTFAYDIPVNLRANVKSAPRDALNSNNPRRVEPESGGPPCDFFSAQSVRRSRDNFIVSRAISNFQRAV